MTAPLRSCRHCVYWKPGATEGLAGECRAHAPVVLMFSDGAESHFPEANADDWCGECLNRPRCGGTVGVSPNVVGCKRERGHDGPCGVTP